MNTQLTELLCGAINNIDQRQVDLMLQLNDLKTVVSALQGSVAQQIASRVDFKAVQADVDNITVQLAALHQALVTDAGTAGLAAVAQALNPVAPATLTAPAPVAQATPAAVAPVAPAPVVTPAPAVVAPADASAAPAVAAPADASAAPAVATAVQAAPDATHGPATGIIPEWLKAAVHKV